MGKDVLSCTSLLSLGHACGLHCLQKELGAVLGWRSPFWRHLHSPGELLLLLWDSCLALCGTTKHHQTMLLRERVPKALGEAVGGGAAASLAHCFAQPGFACLTPPAQSVNAQRRHLCPPPSSFLPLLTQLLPRAVQHPSPVGNQQGPGDTGGATRSLHSAGCERESCGLLCLARWGEPLICHPTARSLGLAALPRPMPEEHCNHSPASSCR